MIVIPSAELRGALVYPPIAQSAKATSPRSPMDPAATHRAFAALGFRQVHLHDLDAQSGSEQNERLIGEFTRESGLEVLVSGGCPSMDWIERLVDAGVSQVILDRGYDGDIDSLGRLADSFPGRLIVRADLPDPLFNRRNSRRNSSAEMVELANDVAALPLGGLAISAFSTDGFPEARLRFIEDLVDASDVPVFFRTEAASVGELHALEELGIAAAVLGSSLFNGQLDAESVARHFDS